MAVRSQFRLLSSLLNLFGDCGTDADTKTTQVFQDLGVAPHPQNQVGFDPNMGQLSGVPAQMA